MSTIQKTAFERIRLLTAEQLGVREDEIKLDTKFITDLGADSLDQVELVMCIEDEFGLEIPDEEAEKILSVQDAVNYVEANAKS